MQFKSQIHSYNCYLTTEKEKNSHTKREEEKQKEQSREMGFTKNKTINKHSYKQTNNTNKQTIQTNKEYNTSTRTIQRNKPYIKRETL